MTSGGLNRKGSKIFSITGKTANTQESQKTKKDDKKKVSINSIGGQKIKDGNKDGIVDFDLNRMLTLRKDGNKEIKKSSILTIEDRVKELLYNFRHRNKFSFKLSKLLMMATVMDLCNISTATKKRLLGIEDQVQPSSPSKRVKRVKKAPSLVRQTSIGLIEEMVESGEEDQDSNMQDKVSVTLNDERNEQADDMMDNVVVGQFKTITEISVGN